MLKKTYEQALLNLENFNTYLKYLNKINANIKKKNMCFSFKKRVS